MIAAPELAGFNAIREWLAATCGIHYPDHKADILRQRLDRVQRAHGVQDIGDLASRVIQQASHELQLAVLHAASTNHTYFYRERQVLDDFVELALPTFRNLPELRIWSAACSTGDEVFTLAMLISDTLGPEMLGRTRILGTDISAQVISMAERATYPARNVEHVPADVLRRHFMPAEGKLFQVRPDVARCATFRRMNLKQRPYPFRSEFHAVFCRNVLYYFDIPDQEQILESICEMVVPGGWLVTSVTERLRSIPRGWTQVTNGILRRNGGA